MYGKAINSLFVSLENMDAQNSTIIWSKQTTQGNQWRLGQATLRLDAGNYRFIIKGVVGGNLLGGNKIYLKKIYLKKFFFFRYCH